MKYRKLGNSGIRVSEISLGSWLTFGGYTDRYNAEEIINTAYEHGINFFDTANVYANGEAERILGDVLNKYPREKLVVATKAFFPVGNGPNDRGLSRKHIIEQCHLSLKRLKMDYLDIFYCHRYDKETPLEESLSTLNDLVGQGKILYIGVSEWTSEQIKEALEIADKRLLHRIVVNQPRYNMIERNIENGLLTFCNNRGIGQVVFSPLAQGLLSGKYTNIETLPSNSRGELNESFKSRLTVDKIRVVHRLNMLAQEIGMSLPQLAIRWVLRHPSICSALTGASNPKQILENVKSVEFELTDSVLKQIDQVLEPTNDLEGMN